MSIHNDFIVAPLTAEIVESTDLASKKVIENMNKDPEKWAKMNQQEILKEINQIYRETALKNKEVY